MLYSFPSLRLHTLWLPTSPVVSFCVEHSHGCEYRGRGAAALGHRTLTKRSQRAADGGISPNATHTHQPGPKGA
ncbi:hypothetical protein C8Q80DRAFT_604519 [Daedaleopsis nitida]|nr:hypothetical protein C8Q80DRAFT_604519 [Daedaleopsis nitida]